MLSLAMGPLGHSKNQASVKHHHNNPIGMVTVFQKANIALVGFIAFCRSLPCLYKWMNQDLELPLDLHRYRTVIRGSINVTPNFTHLDTIHNALASHNCQWGVSVSVNTSQTNTGTRRSQQQQQQQHHQHTTLKKKIRQNSSPAPTQLDNRHNTNQLRDTPYPNKIK